MSAQLVMSLCVAVLGVQEPLCILEPNRGGSQLVSRFRGMPSNVGKVHQLRIRERITSFAPYSSGIAALPFSPIEARRSLPKSPDSRLDVLVDSTIAGGYSSTGP